DSGLVASVTPLGWPGVSELDAAGQLDQACPGVEPQRRSACESDSDGLLAPTRCQQAGHSVKDEVRPSHRSTRPRSTTPRSVVKPAACDGRYLTSPRATCEPSHIRGGAMTP